MTHIGASGFKDFLENHHYLDSIEAIHRLSLTPPRLHYRKCVV
jgi:hypothetical protein